MSVTTKDIARICGISRGTVDRALNNKGRINTDTKEKILRVAQELGYKPDLLARSLSTGHTMTIGVIVFDIRNRYFAQLVNAMEMEARQNGFFLYISLQEKDPETEIELIDSLVGRRVDGIIMCPVNKGDTFNANIASQPIPIITVGNKISDEIPYVGIDESKAAYSAVEHIIAKGYQEIVFVCPPLHDREVENIYVHEERYNGYKEALKKYPDVKSYVIRRWDYLLKVEELYNNSKNRIAFFCSGDTYALEIIKLFRKKGIRIPEDAGLMGFDNIDTLEYVIPELTTIGVPLREIGEASVKLLINKISGDSAVNNLILPYHLIDGKSL